MIWGAIYWPFFLAVMSAFFLAPEFFALLTNPANTLSDYCWRMLNVTMSHGQGIHTIAWWSSLVSWLLAVVLLTIHIWWRGI